MKMWYLLQPDIFIECSSVVDHFSEEDDNWKCYICNPSSLERLRKDCDRVLETVEEAARKKQELKDQKEQSKKERMQKKEEKAKAKSTTTGKGSSPKKTPPQSVSQEIMQQLLSRNKNQVYFQ